MKSFSYKGQTLHARVDRPNELDTASLPLAELDGWRRNVAKVKWEWRWSIHWAGEAEAGHGWLFTAALNWFVAALRHAPYLWGHILPPVFVLAIII